MNAEQLRGRPSQTMRRPVAQIRLAKSTAEASRGAKIGGSAVHPSMLDWVLPTLAIRQFPTRRALD